MKAIQFDFNEYLNNNPDNLIAILYHPGMIEDPFLFFLN